MIAMSVIDFSKIEDVDDFSPVPAGSYLVRVDEVKEATTQRGDEMWRLRYVIEQGAYSGRCIFDRLVFSEAALPRVKLICSRLGLDVSGELDLRPELIEGCSCVLSVEIDEYEDEEGGTKSRNVVPFAGYDYPDALLEPVDSSKPF
jgi:hypothetical protein